MVRKIGLAAALIASLPVSSSLGNNVISQGFEEDSYITYNAGENISEKLILRKRNGDLLFETHTKTRNFDTHLSKTIPEYKTKPYVNPYVENYNLRRYHRIDHRK